MGPTQDSLAFFVSSYSESLLISELTHIFWLSADDAYPCDDYIGTPLSSSEAPFSFFAQAIECILAIVWYDDGFIGYFLETTAI